MELRREERSLGEAYQAFQRAIYYNKAAQSGYKPILGMVIHLSNADIARRTVILNTDVTTNVISHRVVQDLELEMGQYVGGLIARLGGLFLPIGTVVLEWHVLNRKVTHKTEFAVLEDRYSRDFDVLLGEETIRENSFLRANNTVF